MPGMAPFQDTQATPRPAKNVSSHSPFRNRQVTYEKLRARVIEISRTILASWSHEYSIYMNYFIEYHKELNTASQKRSLNKAHSTKM